MFCSTRSKLIASLLGVSVLVGAVSLFIGGHLLYRTVLSEATNRVSLDLNAAREIYLPRINSVKVSLNITTLGFGFRSALVKYDSPELLNRLRRLAQHAELDFAGIVTREGKTLHRIGPNPMALEGSQPANPIANLAFKHGVPVSGTVVLTKEFLFAENPELAERARIRLLPTPRALVPIRSAKTKQVLATSSLSGKFLLKCHQIYGILLHCLSSF